jgi:nucleotide-binding universal stress UspA family protein
MPGLLVCGIEDRDDIAPVRVAKVLSDALDLGILLLHVADAPPGLVPVWPDTGRAQHRTVTSAQVADGEQLLEEVASRHGLRPADRRVVAGRCAAELAASAVAERATLLVVGCRRTGVVRRALRGTVAQRLASGAPCPVVVAPPALGEGVDWPHKPPGGPVSEPNLVCGVDGSEIADRAVALATSLADGLRARVVLAHVLDPGADVVVGPDGPLSMDFSPLFDSDVCVGLKLLQEALSRVSALVPAELRLLQGEVAEQLGALAISEGSELIVVGSRGRGALRSALLGSTSAKLAARAPVPVVIFPSALGRRNPGAGDELAWTA